MGESTLIGWTDRTFNPWKGCTKVGPGCDMCYAEAWSHQFHKGSNWGPGAPRIRTSQSYWKAPRKWNREAAAGGPRWVFCASLADVFDNEVDPSWRMDLWDLVRDCTELRWQFVTKRIVNARRMLPDDWDRNFSHCGLIVSITDQREADRELPELRDTPARWRGVSYEPALHPVDWTAHLSYLDWLIVGGESGPRARPFDPSVAELAVVQGREHGVPVFVKQMGARPVGMDLLHKKGEDPGEWPVHIRVQEMPRVYGVS